MTVIVFDPAAFRANPLFSAYSKNPPYTDAYLQSFWDSASMFITKYNSGCYGTFMRIDQQALALQLLTAHLIFITTAANSGDTPGIVTGASIDKVSVQIAEPPASNQWQYWLLTSPYGRQLLPLLLVAGVGGQYYVSRNRSLPPFVLR